MELLVVHEKSPFQHHPYGIAKVLSTEEHRCTAESLDRINFEKGFKLGQEVTSRTSDEYIEKF